MISLSRERLKAIIPATADFRAGLLQSGLGGCPWRVIVASMLGRERDQVEPVLRRLLTRWPDAPSLAHEDDREVEEILRPLDLQRQSVRRLVRFSNLWLSQHWDYLIELPGCGLYVYDAVGLVCFGCTDLETQDPALRMHVARMSKAASDNISSGK